MKTYSDIREDVESQIADQIYQQREKIKLRLSNISHILAIGSGKGGVGKSTLAMQIACAFRNKEISTSILDADINGPSQVRLGGIKESLLVPGEDGLLVPKTKNGVGVLSFASIFSEDTSTNFASVAKGDSHTWRSVKEFSVLANILAGTDWEDTEILIVDLPPGAERTFQFAEFLGNRATLLLVTIPSELSRGVVKRSIHALNGVPNKLLGYIENMKGYYCQDCGEIKPLFPSSGEIDLEIPCLGSVPFDPKLAEMCDNGRSISDLPDLPCSQAVEEISRNIQNALAHE